MPKQDNVSIHSGACEICQLNGYPHVYHGSYGCVYQYDHTCPWVASDIGNSNKIPFFIIVLSLFLLSGITMIFYSTCAIATFQWHFQTFPSHDMAIIEKFTYKSSAIILYAVGNIDNVLQLVMQFMVFVPALVQIIQQLYTMRHPMCFSSYSYVKNMRKRVKKGTIIVGRNNDLVYFVAKGKKEQITDLDGNIIVDGKRLAVKYENRENSLIWLGKELQKGSIVDTFKSILSGQQITQKW
eukprot:EST42459.1 DHHC zinc finger domain-containing protein [Spironucleus salmonicida]